MTAEEFISEYILDFYRIYR